MSSISACTVRQMSLEALAGSVTGSGRVYASEGDQELVRGAMPFALKTIETLLAELPTHQELLLSAARGFALYAYAFVSLDADDAERNNWAQAKEMRGRARGLYLRARDYGIRALEIPHPGFREMLEKDVSKVLKELKREDVPALYWVGTAWGAAISVAKGEMDLVADLKTVELLMRRVLELDEGFEEGGVHEFFLVYEAGRPDSSSVTMEKARAHFKRAIELSEGKKLSPLVSLAEAVSVRLQNKDEFSQLLHRVLTFPLDQAAEHRFANTLAQRRARQLFARIDELFL